MDTYKLIGISILSLIICLILKEYKKEYEVYVLLILGIIIFTFSADKIKEIINLIKNISNKSGQNFIELLLKITGISILAEYSMSICKDSGENSIANKIDFGTKIIIVSLSIPVISSTLETLLQMLP